MFTRSTGEVRVLVDDLFFANGIQLFPDRESVLIAETTMARITRQVPSLRWSIKDCRYYLAGTKRGQREVFAENLPGLPDNIRLSHNGTFWVGMAGIRQHGRFSFLDFVAEKPWLRKAILKVEGEICTVQLR